MAYTTADFPTLQNEKFANFVQSTLIQSQVLSNTVMDLTSLVSDGDTSVSVPRKGNFATQTKVEGTDLSPIKRPYAKDSIDLNIHETVPFSVEMRARKQTVVGADYLNGIEGAMEALALKMDVDIHAKLVAAAAGNSGVAASNAQFMTSRADVVELRKLLNKKVIPKSDRFLVIGTDDEANLLNIDEFVHADKYGSRESLLNGEIGRLFGFTVIMTTVADGSAPVAYHKSSCAFARQIMPQIVIEEKALGLKWDIVAHHLYGVEAMDVGNRAATLELAP